MKSDGRRPARVAEGIRERIAELLMREVHDPRLASLVITGVEMTDDLSVAKVHVRLLADDAEQERKRLMSSLARRVPHFRKAIGATMSIRRLPELRFFYDAGLDNVRRVEEILAELKEEEEQRGAEDEVKGE